MHTNTRLLTIAAWPTHKLSGRMKHAQPSCGPLGMQGGTESRASRKQPCIVLVYHPSCALSGIYTYMCIHTYIHTYIYIYIYKYIHTYTHTYIYTKYAGAAAPPLPPNGSPPVVRCGCGFLLGVVAPFCPCFVVWVWVCLWWVTPACLGQEVTGIWCVWNSVNREPGSYYICTKTK